MEKGNTQAPAQNSNQQLDGDLMFKIIGQQQYAITDLQIRLTQMVQQNQTQNAKLQELTEKLKNLNEKKDKK